MKLWIEHRSWGEVSAEFCDPLGAAAAARELTCPQIPPQQNQLRLMQPRAATLHKQLRAVTLPNQLHAGCSFVLPVVRRLGGAYHLFKGWLVNLVNAVAPGFTKGGSDSIASRVHGANDGRMVPMSGVWVSKSHSVSDSTSAEVVGE